MARRKQSIKSLRKAQALIDTKKDILKELVAFYESLHAEYQQFCEREFCDYVKALSPPNITKAKASKCEKLSIENKCQKAIF